MNILWLASWYPNQIEPLNGDFIQRHAQAVSLYNAVTVICVVRDKKGDITRNVLVQESSQKNLHEQIIYYYSPAYYSLAIDKFFSYLKYKKVFKRYIDKYISENGKPALVHVHEGMKAGLLAMWLKKKSNIRYVITEHWAGFIPGAISRFEDLPVYLRQSWQRLIKRASAVSVVSEHLRLHMQRTFGKLVPVTVIPNVVNTNIFYPVKKEKNTATEFIHISGLDFQKNPEAILQALAIVKRKGGLFYLDIFGPEKKELRQLASELGLSGNITFYKEMPQPELVKYVRRSDGLILYSRYETFGCVLIEANACGIPVIASDIPPINEIIANGKNGILAKTENVELLADAILEFINRKNEFDADRIAEVTVNKYSYEVVGELFSKWYSELINTNNFT